MPSVGASLLVIHKIQLVGLLQRGFQGSNFVHVLGLNPHTPIPKPKPNIQSKYLTPFPNSVFKDPQWLYSSIEYFDVRIRACPIDKGVYKQLAKAYFVGLCIFYAYCKNILYQFSYLQNISMS